MNYEEATVGEPKETGTYTVTEEEITEFAERWDPQPFHVDREAAAASPFGTLVASGWHTVCITMRLMVMDVFGPGGSLGSPGVNSIDWPNPLLPGETVYARVEVDSKRPLESNPSVGLLQTSGETVTEEEKTVLEMESAVFVRRDPDGN